MFLNSSRSQVDRKYSESETFYSRKIVVVVVRKATQKELLSFLLEVCQFKSAILLKKYSSRKSKKTLDEHYQHNVFKLLCSIYMSLSYIRRAYFKCPMMSLLYICCVTSFMNDPKMSFSSPSRIDLSHIFLPHISLRHTFWSLYFDNKDIS